MKISILFPVVLLTIFFALILAYQDSYSQCAMCKAVVESNQKGGGGVGSGINHAILYLMAMPYAAVGIGIYFFFFRSKRVK